MTPGGPKHTPGPWTNDGSRSVRATVDGQEITVAGAKLYIVPIAPGVTTYDRGQADANARLIAAAPDLLAAVGGFLWLGNNLHNIKAAPDQFRAYYEAALVDAVAAYNKALGEDRGPVEEGG